MANSHNLKIKISNMRQTAVEWLVKQIKSSKHYYKLIEELDNRGTVAQPSIIKQAKQMEKAQIKDAYKYGLQDDYVIGAEQYYNETFKQKQYESNPEI